MKKLLFYVLTLILAFSLVGCGSGDAKEGTVSEENSQKELKSIKIACAETTQALVEAVIPVMKEKGYNVEFEMFDNNVNTLYATNDGSVDALFLVHKPFMENFNSSNDGDLVMIEPHVFSVGMGLFSEKYNNMDEFPEGSSIAIMNDAMNMDRALRIFSDGGFITLKDDVDKCTLLDIKENPHNFKFVEMDQTQTVRSLQDMDGSVAFFSHMKNADKDFNSYIIRDKHPENYPQGLIVKEQFKDEKWVKDLVDSFRSEEVRKFAEEYYGGLYEYID